MNGVEMKIVLSNEEPIYQSSRRLPLPEKQEVKKQVNEWLEDGIIRPSSSDFACPTELVHKKDGTNRMCVDALSTYPAMMIIENVVLRKVQGAQQQDSNLKAGREVFKEKRYELRKNARLAIRKMQEENRKSYNKKQKIALTYQVGDVVAIKRTQFGTQNKLFPRFLGPYKVIKIKGHDRYDVERVGKGEGPRITSSSADNMKLWKLVGTDDDESSGSDDLQDGRVVGV